MCEELLKQLESIQVISELKQTFILRSNEYLKDSEDEISIGGMWAFKNFSSNQSIMINILYTCDLKQKRIYSTPPVIVDSRLILTAVSPCFSTVAQLFQDDENCFLKTSNASYHNTIDLKKDNAYGKVYSDKESGYLSWSCDSKYLAFSAEKKSHVQASGSLSKELNSDDEVSSAKHAYVDDWGEQLSGCVESVVVVVDLKSQTVKVLQLPDGLFGSQVVWTSDGGLVGVAYVTKPFRLGLIYCLNRESVLFHLDRDGNYTELTQRGNHVHSPRFSPDGSKLVYFQCPVGGPHVRSVQLCLMNWNNKEVTILIDFVATKMTILDDESFYGLCGYSILPKNCWSPDSKFLVFSAMDNFAFSTYILDTGSKQIKKVSIKGSVVAQDVRGDFILSSVSSVTEPQIIALIRLNDVADIMLTPSDRRVKGIPPHWQEELMFHSESPNPSYVVSSRQIPALYVGPTKRESETNDKRPLIVWVHGGPHGMVKNEFMLDVIFYLRLGYSILFPNYRGSVGQGKDALESLPGHIGTADVADVYNATVFCLERYKDVLDKTRVALCGGSHGGFLVTHLSAQFPDLYKVVSSRNPVIDVSSMVTETDIPDWTFVEGVDGCYTTGRSIDTNTLSEMYSKSPVSLVDKVRAPTLLLLGKEDRRVPLSQGLFYYKMLLARNVETKTYIYPDNHALQKPEVHADCLIKTALWYQKYL